jgi:hypothetical protein
MKNHIYIPQSLWSELSKVAAQNKVSIPVILEALNNQFYGVKK